MAEQTATLEVQLDVGAGDDPEELDELTASLHGQLLELDVEAVDRPRGDAPPGTRAADAAELGKLMVTFGPTVLGSVVQTIRTWLSRGRGRSVKLRLGDDAIEVTGASSEQQEQLIAAFLARHSGA